MTVADIDEQMFGLSDAPPYVSRADDRSLRCTLRLGRKTARALLRPDREMIERDRGAAAAWIAALPALEGAADDEQLIEIARRLPPKFEVMMSHLLLASAFAGISRAMIERLTAGFDDVSLVNRLTAGLGTIESAEPAFALWRLGRVVAGSTHPDGGVRRGRRRARVATSPRRSRRRLRGRARPLRPHLRIAGPRRVGAGLPHLGHRPRDRPRGDRAVCATHRRSVTQQRAQERLAAARAEATAMVLGRLRAPQRALFRRALASALVYAAAREATKATFVRCLEPARRALHELARRHQLDRADLFLLTFDELATFLRSPDEFTDVIAERRREPRLPPGPGPAVLVRGRDPTAGHLATSRRAAQYQLRRPARSWVSACARVSRRAPLAS